MKKYSILLLAALLFVSLTVNCCSNANASNFETVASSKIETTKAAAKSTKDGLQVGDKAPDFTLPNIDGKEYSLADVTLADGSQPKGYIVVFTCNTCPYAVANEDRLIELHNKMAKKGYPVVAIQPNDPQVKPGDSMEKMKQRAAEKGFPFLYLMDEKQEIFPLYGATRTPEIYLLDQEMTLRYTGAIDNSAMDASAVSIKYVEDAVEAIEKGNDPEPNFTRALGCSIKKKRS